MIRHGLFASRRKKRVLIAIHGFGRRKQEDFHYLKTMCEADSGLEYRCFDLYDEDKNEKEWLVWVARANQEVTAYLEKGYEVTLLGFSMGGVIAGVSGFLSGGE